MHGKVVGSTNFVVHLVAVVHGEGPLPERAQALAAALSCSVVEGRQRLVATPSIVARAPTAEGAAEIVGRLKTAGFTALAFDPVESPFVKRQLQVRSFELHEDRLSASPRQGAGVQVPFDTVRLILRGTQTATEVQEKTVTAKKFNPALAVATGGLMMRTNKRKMVKSVSDSMSGFVHVYATKGPPLLFSEFNLDFRGLGDALEKSRILNMKVLLDTLRSAAPQASFDDRLMRRAGQSQLLGPGLPPEANLAIASGLLAMAAWASPVSAST